MTSSGIPQKWVKEPAMGFSQLDHLKKIRAEIAAGRGEDAFSVRQLTQQIRSMERTLSGKVTENPVVMSAHFEKIAVDQDDD